MSTPYNVGRVRRSRNPAETLKQFLVLAVLTSIILLLTQAAPWVLIAALAVALISLLIILDAFFFAGKVYHNPREPTAISGLLQLAPWLAYPFVATDFSALGLTGLAFCSGVLNLLGFYLYFQAMEKDQDAVVIAVMWNVMIALVPLLAWLTIGETLAAHQYGGIALVFAGAMFTAFHKTRANGAVVARMAGAIVLMSITAVMMKHVYSQLVLANHISPFWSGFLPHAAGSGLVGLAFFAGLNVADTRAHFLPMVQRLWPVFLLIETVQIAADVLYSLALSMGLVSIVAAMDGLMGIFTAGLVLLLAKLLAGSRYRDDAKRLYAEQLNHFPLKLTGMMSIAVGAYFIV